MAYADPEVGRAADRERFRMRTAARIAQGLCARSGEVPPVPERSLCGPCADKRNKASRARDARLRAEGKPRRNPEAARAYGRNRWRCETAARHAEGLCIRCGKEPAAPDRASCEPCLEKRRADDRARYAAGKAAGLKYGGADIEAKRRAGRTKSKRRQKKREAGLCIRCGKRTPVEGGTTCTPCPGAPVAGQKPCGAEHRQAQDRAADAGAEQALMQRGLQDAVPRHQRLAVPVHAPPRHPHDPAVLAPEFDDRRKLVEAYRDRSLDGRQLARRIPVVA